MGNFVLAPPQFGFLLVTRAMLALGIGLLIADRIPQARRKQLGKTLVGLGALTTVPGVMTLRGSYRPEAIRVERRRNV
jgi:hypothetical protein